MCMRGALRSKVPGWGWGWGAAGRLAGAKRRAQGGTATAGRQAGSVDGRQGRAREAGRAAPAERADLSHRAALSPCCGAKRA